MPLAFSLLGRIYWENNPTPPRHDEWPPRENTIRHRSILQKNHNNMFPSLNFNL